MKPANSLRMPSGSWPRWLTAAGVLLALGLSGCGSDGSSGPAGSSGTNTDSGITSSTTLTAVDNAPGVVIAVTSVTGQTGPGGNFQVGDKPSVTFTVKKTNGTAWHLSEMSTGRIMISGPTYNYQRVIPSQSDLITRSVVNGDGSYTYTFASGFPATYAAPLNDSATHGANDGELQGQALLAGTYNIGLVTYWKYTVDGVEKRDVGNKTHDVLLGASAVSAARQVVKNDNCNTCHVKIQAHGGTYQDTGVCVLCHTAGAEDQSAAYPGATGAVPGTRIEFKMMIHRIHNGAHLPSVLGVATNNDGSRNYAATPVGDVIIGRNGTPYDFSGVVSPIFPSFSSAMPKDAGYSGLSAGQKTQEDNIRRGIVACYKCHGDPDGSGAMTAPSQGDLHTTQASRRACGSCHDDIDWTKPYTANGMTMPPQTDDASCNTCHAPTGMTGIAVAGGTVPSTPFAHIHPMADSTRITGADAYNKDIVFNVTGMSGNSAAYFAAGEKPAISFTVKDNTGADLPLYKLSAISTTLAGPTDNRQLVFPMNGPKSATVPVCDFSGRLVLATATAGNGSMSRVVGSTASETLKVQFTSATAFTVWGGGSALALRGSSALASATSSNPNGSSISAIELTDAAVAQTITVAFSSSTAFTVTGSSSGAMGSGTMPAATNASVRFTSTDGTLAFTIASGGTAFASPNTIHLTVFKASAPNNSHTFAIVAGRTTFTAGDRFYYETVNNSLLSYTYNLPMDMILEFVGDATAASGDSFTAGNLPVYFGRETVYERTATSGGSSALSADAAASARYVELASVASLAANDYVVLDDGTAGAEEYIQVGTVIGSKVWFKTPIRYAHANGVTCKEVTLTARKESIHYTLDSATGVITTTSGFTNTNAVVVSYRTDGSFGWRRSNLDAVASDPTRAIYPPPMNDSPDLDQTWGEWQGLRFAPGSYTAAIWGSWPTYLTQQGETQTYTIASSAGLYDFRYGSAGTVAHYDLVSSENNCAACHDGIFFHGGSRKGNDTCLTCHATAGMEDWPDYGNGVTTGTTPGVTANFRTMLHKIHMGEELTNASTYTVKGNNGSNSQYDEVVFPVLPGGTKACDKCHGTDSTMWIKPAARTYPGPSAAPATTRSWMTVCSSCHDSTDAGTHIDAMTTSQGAESCITCHGEGQVFGVDTVHKNR